MDGWKIAVGATWLAVGFAVPASAQVTQRVSVATDGTQGNFDSDYLSISADGRYVTFSSSANNLVPGDTNATEDVFIHDRQNGTTERVSVNSEGVEGNSQSGYDGVSVSADGRYVAFRSSATNLITGTLTGWPNLFVRDRLSGTIELVSVGLGGAEENGDSERPVISADGRFVTFFSWATNLVSGDTNGFIDAFVRDRDSATTERVSLDSGGMQGNGESYPTSISADGRYVTFYSDASNLVPGDTNGQVDVFVCDRQNGTTERVSIDSSGTQGNDDSGGASISADGRYVAFGSYATNLVSGDTNGRIDVFVRDRTNGTTERVSVGNSGLQGNGDSAVYGLSISADGRYVAFSSNATNLVTGDTNGHTDIFMRDRLMATTDRLNVDSSGTEADGDCITPSISADGRNVAFATYASNLVPGDTNGRTDVFVRDRAAAGFTSFCDSGVGGVTSCPCSNPPSSTGRGCDNSAATGGASLAASGIAYLSIDSLAFTTSGEKPNALSIVMQGNGVISNGVAYGQGVRCVGGTIIRRLFIKSATAGSITVPDFGAGDPTVSARSAAKGDLIQPGQSRWYLVYYRDPVVLGGCPASSTFNATQTGRVDWSM